MHSHSFSLDTGISEHHRPPPRRQIIVATQGCPPQTVHPSQSQLLTPSSASYRLPLGKYRLLNAFPNVLILLPTVAPPSCILLASASSSADCVTDASVPQLAYIRKSPAFCSRVIQGCKCLPSRSLKLLHILGVPSLPSRPLPFPLPANSAVLLGESGTLPPLPVPAGYPLCPTAAELVDESLV
jgi:hypothetical protein